MLSGRGGGASGVRLGLSPVSELVLDNECSINLLGSPLDRISSVSTCTDIGHPGWRISAHETPPPAGDDSDQGEQHSYKRMSYAHS